MLGLHFSLPRFWNLPWSLADHGAKGRADGVSPGGDLYGVNRRSACQSGGPCLPPEDTSGLGAAV